MTQSTDCVSLIIAILGSEISGNSPFNSLYLQHYLNLLEIKIIIKCTLEVISVNRTFKNNDACKQAL